MKVLYRYIISKKIRYLISSLVVLSFFIFIINLFEGINTLSRKNIPLSEIFNRAIHTTPYYVYLLTPLITMIACIMVLNYFKNSSEYKAILSSGYSTKIFIISLLISSAIFSIFLLLFLDSKVSEIYAKIKKTAKLVPEINVKYRDLIINADVSDTKSIKSLYIYDISSSKIIYADKGRWDGKIWKLEKVSEINKKDRNIIYHRYNQKTYPQLPPPEILLVEELTDTASYSIKSLIFRIKKLKMLSLNTNEEEVLIYFRISVIMINIISAFIAFIIFKTPIIKSKPASISLSVFFSFGIWFLLTLFKRMADMEIIPPVFVLLIPHTIIITAALWISSKLEISS